MRTSQLVTSYIQALFFAGLGLWAVNQWLRERDRRSGHLAMAAGLFGLQSLTNAVTTTIWNNQALPPETPPRALSIFTSILLFLAIWGFLLFLSDFINFHPVVHALIILVTLVSIVLAIIERPDIRFDPQRGLVKIPGVDNPIDYTTYIEFVLLYLAIAFGALALSFLVYGFRSTGLARFRMLTIGTGFTLFFIAIGLIPRLLIGNPSAETIRNIGNAVRYLALFSAPLLFLGFAPPKFVRDRFREPEPASR